MKKILQILTIIFISSYSIAQTFNLEFDHTTILVKNIEVSTDFYKNILKFKEIPTPWGKINWGRFFEIGNNRQLHMALGEADSVRLDKMLHIAFSVDDFDNYLSFLDDKGIQYSTFKGESKKFQTRPDEVRQIYFQDPDGYWIEINDAKY